MGCLYARPDYVTAMSYSEC